MISRLTKIPEPGRVALMSLCCHPVMKPSWATPESEGGKLYAENSEGGN